MKRTKMERKLEALLEIYCDFDDVGGLRNKTGRMYRVQTSEKGFYIIQKLLFQLRLFSASIWLNLDKFLPPRRPPPASTQYRGAVLFGTSSLQYTKPLNYSVSDLATLSRRRIHFFVLSSKSHLYCSK